MIIIIPIIGIALLVIGFLGYMKHNAFMASIGLVLGIFATFGGGAGSAIGIVHLQNKAYYGQETAYEYRENINISAANMLKSADTLLTFVDKETDTYKEVMQAIADARTSGYSGATIERVYTIIHEAYPTDMEIGQQWQTYMKSVETAYDEIMVAQKDYNSAVKEYRSLFTPVNKVMFFVGECDESIKYYSLDYTIDYTTTNN